MNDAFNSSMTDYAVKLARHDAVLTRFYDASFYTLKKVMLYAGAVFIIICIHTWSVSDVYRVQLAKLTGGYVNTDAVVIKYEKHRKYRKYRVGTPDGTVLDFESDHLRAEPGEKLNVSYDRHNPDCAYINDHDYFFWHYIKTWFWGIMFLYFAVSCFCRTLGYARLSKLRKYSEPLTAELDADRNCDKKKVVISKQHTMICACWFKFVSPGYAPVRFHGIWHILQKNETADNIMDKAKSSCLKCRIYMFDLDNPRDGRYFIEEIPDIGFHFHRM